MIMGSIALILLMGVISFLLRASPFFVKQQNIDTQSIFMKSMDYAVCIILGNVIFNIAFQQADLNKFIEGFDLRSVITIVILLFAYSFTKATRSILKSLMLSLGLFILLTSFL